MLPPAGEGRRWKPKRLRLRLISAAGQLAMTGRRQYLRIARHWPWAHLNTTAFDRLQALPKPG
ncbi:transposase [Actinacidiphila glaucinigra]|uniref:transposase n=1 Tax=Actinacidiphila glaucinigra TaxID=235986 RepID=UPI0037C7CB3B